MSFFGKLAFWKKSEPDLSADFGDFSLPGQAGKSDLGLTEGEFARNQGEFDSTGGFGQGAFGQGAGGGQGFGQGSYGQTAGAGQGGYGQTAGPGHGGYGQGAGFQAAGPDMRAASRFQQVQQESYNPAYGASETRSSQPLFAQQSSADIINSKNYEVMMSKLDALSAQLESINQRLKNIERIAINDERKKERSW